MIVVVLALPLIGLTLSALVPAYGVPLTFATATFENFRFVLMEHGGAARAFGNSILLPPSCPMRFPASCWPLPVCCCS